MENGKLIKKFGDFEVWESNGKYYGVDAKNKETKPRPYSTKEMAIKVARNAHQWYDKDLLHG